MTTTLDLQIDTITLQGSSRFSPHHLRLAIEEELSTLLHQNGIPSTLRSGTMPLIQAPIEIPQRATLQQTSAEIAATIYRALSAPRKDHQHPRGPR